MMKFYAEAFPTWAIFLIVLGFFALIAIVAYVIHRILRPRLKDEDKKESEKEHAQEELDRILQPVEDDEVSKQIQNYKEDDE